MTIRPTIRVGAASLALGFLLVAPAAVSAADPDDVAAWQAHRDHMLATGDPGLGGHIVDCVAEHDSAAGLLGPNGMMVGGMGGGEVVR